MTTIIRTDQLFNTSATPILPPKPLPTSSAAPQLKPAKPLITAPRIDLQPLYAQLQNALGASDWSIYKESVSFFVLGSLNQAEFAERINPLVCANPEKAHYHNLFINAVLGNLSRDAPEPGVASWVSANDKPTAVSKPTSGDGAEQRLKTEVMNLTGRERRRLKQIQEDPRDYFAQTLNEYHQARTIRPPDIAPVSAGGFANKTNWELEIRKKYNQPLYSETNQFPDPETIQARVVPICYEEGLINGCAGGVAEFVTVATEFYIKEVLSSFFSRVSSNGENFVQTGKFKRRLEREEEAWLRGEVTKTTSGLLPVEVEENTKRKPLTMEDLKIALQLGDPFLGQVPLLAGQIQNCGWNDPDAESEIDTPKRAQLRPKPLTNGHPTNGDAMDIDEPELSFKGVSDADERAIHSVLDDVLAIGD